VQIVIPMYECSVVVVMFLAMKFQVGLLNLTQDILILDIEPISIEKSYLAASFGTNLLY